MRIATIGSNLRVAGGASVGQNLATSLLSVAPMHSYLFIVPKGQAYESLGSMPNVDILEIDSHSVPGRALEILHDIPRILQSFSPDFVWALGNLPVRHPPSPQALLIHDAHLFYPAAAYSRELWLNRQKHRVTRAYLRTSLRFVGTVFCQTRTAARRFENLYGHPAVTVMPNAVSSLIDLPDQVISMPRQLTPYMGHFRLFALTKYYSHKNLELILDAYREYGKTLLAGTACFITVSATQHPHAARFLRRIENEAPDQIINLGPIPQRRLGSYFRFMETLVHPSILESFSATYVEAMAFGTPILASDLDFAHEVCGNAAIYFDPEDPLTLARCIEKIRDDSDLRTQLAQKGRIRLAAMPTDWRAVVSSALDSLGIQHL